MKRYAIVLILTSCRADAATPDPLSFDVSSFMSSKLCREFDCSIMKNGNIGKYPMGGAEIKILINKDTVGNLNLSGRVIEQYSFVIKQDSKFIIKNVEKYSKIFYYIFEALFGKKNYMDSSVFENSIKNRYRDKLNQPYYIIKTISKDSKGNINEYITNLDINTTDNYPNNRYVYMFGYRR